jgi:hypothetical protein
VSDRPGERRATILEEETLAEHWRPLRRYTLDFRRRDGTHQRLSREVYFNASSACLRW